MKNKIETKLQMACRQIPNYLQAMELLKQYVLINGMSEATLSSYTRKLTDLALYFNKLPQHITEDELREYLCLLIKEAKSNSKMQLRDFIPYFMRFFSTSTF